MIVAVKVSGVIESVIAPTLVKEFLTVQASLALERGVAAFTEGG